MGSQISTRKRHSRGSRLALAAVAGASLLGGSPAQAENKFENAFEDQLGRIAAYQVAFIGKNVLFGAHAPHRARHAAIQRLRHRHAAIQRLRHRHAAHRRGEHRYRCDHRGGHPPWIRGVRHRCNRDERVVHERHSARTPGHRHGEVAVRARRRAHPGH